MTVLQNILQAVSHLFQWWFIVQPWEQGVRVRIGKQVRKFETGMHFCIPFVDKIYVQNTRLRISAVPTQTVTTRDGRTITICGSVRYRITDTLKLHQTLHQPDETLGQDVVGRVARYVIVHELKDCTPEKIAAAVTTGLDFEKYGLADAAFFLTDFAVVRTYRLVNDRMGEARWVSQQLDTNKPVALIEAQR